jgi:uncharacterized protein with GYD domain
MPIFVVLAKMTEQGAKNVKDLERILADNRAGAEKFGVKAHAVYVTQGQYDFVIIAEAPNEEAMTAQSMSVASRGYMKGETLRAFTLDEAKGILQKLA